jgi:hypothetical protein
VSAWLLLIEALALGAQRDRIDELAAKWGCNDEDAQHFVEYATAEGEAGLYEVFKLFRDGDRWGAAFHDFVNVQESPCGFGKTALEAFAELANPGLIGGAGIMAHHDLEFEAECKACGASGLYVGLAERDGSAVVCHICKGTGKETIKISYDEFTCRKPVKEPVERVFEVNPGIVIGKGNDGRYSLSDFGGMPFEDWNAGAPFPKGSENRKFTCPAWWYQSADYEKKPNWKECESGSFSKCSHFFTKEECWKRWDKENSGEGAA